MSAQRIGFDALFLEQPMTGVGQYALHLWQQLRDDQQFVDPQLLMPADAAAPARDESRPESTYSAKPPPRVRNRYARKLWWEQSGLPRATKKARVELVHVPHFAAPLRQCVPHIVTVHDVIPLALPLYGGSPRMKAYMRLVKRSVRKAALLLTDSEFSKRDIIHYLGIDAERIVVTPLAASDDLTPATTSADQTRIAAVKEKFGLQRPYVLNVGGFDARKRVPHLIRGFAAASPSLAEPHDLVLVGRAHTGNSLIYPAVDQLIQDLGIADRVKLVGFVSEEEKRDLYRGAEAFAFASEYEGFGLNPLEAMACGTPVISSNRSSLPEVVGDAGLLIDPEPEAFARAIVHVLTDSELRANLSQRSLKRANKFSWKRTAELTLAAYERVLTEQK